MQATSSCLQSAWRAQLQPQGQQRRRAPQPAAVAAAQQERPAAARPADGQQRSWGHAAASWAAGMGAASLLLLGSGAPALAAARSPPIADSAGRCDIAALDKFAGGCSELFASLLPFTHFCHSAEGRGPCHQRVPQQRSAAPQLPGLAHSHSHARTYPAHVPFPPRRHARHLQPGGQRRQHD